MSAVRPFVMITAPAYWSSYLVNGDASGLSADEKAQADAWLAREEVKVIDLERDNDGEIVDARFTWSYGLYAPDSDVKGGEVLDYVCEPLKPEEWEHSSFI